jgi:outer membrane protein assembly factor BamB
MIRLSTIFTLLMLAFPFTHGHAAVPATKTLPLAEDVDVVLFPSTTLAIVADMAGLATRTASLQAFTLPDWTPKWSAKVELGKRDYVKKVAAWCDDTADRLYVGSGPVTALDANSGAALWKLDYDNTGIVSDVSFRGGRLLVLGTK